MSISNENTSNVVNQIHPTVEFKCDTWKQLSKSYSGGITYREGDYLHKFSVRESTRSFDERKDRAIYMNNVQPFADMFVGFLMSGDVRRENITLEYIQENANLYSDLDSFMRQVATNSLLYTCGVLVDSPQFDRDLIQTEGDRAAAGINPYCILYHPWQIRNFNIGKDGKLNWLLLDNTYYDNTDPFQIAGYKVLYRLWTREYYQDFLSDANSATMYNDSSNSAFYGLDDYEGAFTPGEQVFHGLKEIPFIFCNWNDRANTFFADTIFEDIALFDQGIYNYMSLLDEMLYGGSFKYLVCQNEIPPEIKANAGFSNLAVLSYSGDTPPQFIGPSLNDISPFLEAVNFLLIGIQRALGLNTDQEKSYAASGAAKKFDFTKVKSFLVSGARSMEQIEKSIFRFAGLWEGKDEQVDIEYRKDFLGTEEEDELARMYNLLTLQYKGLRKMAAHRIAEIEFGDKLDERELNDINQDIDETEETPMQEIDMGKLTAIEQAQQQTIDNKKQGESKNETE